LTYIADLQCDNLAFGHLRSYIVKIEWLRTPKVEYKLQGHTTK